MTDRRTQIKVYAGQHTARQWHAICDQFTGNTAAFAAMVQNFLTTQIESDEQRLRRGDDNVPCAGCEQSIDPATTWHPGIYGEVYCAQCAS